jgi:hypothetical protein
MKDNLRNLKDGEAMDQRASHGCLRRIDPCRTPLRLPEVYMITNADVVLQSSFFVASFISLGARPMWPGILASPDPQSLAVGPDWFVYWRLLFFFRARVAIAWSFPA